MLIKKLIPLVLIGISGLSSFCLGEEVKKEPLKDLNPKGYVCSEGYQGKDIRLRYFLDSNYKGVGKNTDIREAFTGSNKHKSRVLEYVENDIVWENPFEKDKNESVKINRDFRITYRDLEPRDGLIDSLRDPNGMIKRGEDKSREDEFVFADAFNRTLKWGLEYLVPGSWKGCELNIIYEFKGKVPYSLEVELSDTGSDKKMTYCDGGETVKLDGKVDYLMLKIFEGKNGKHESGYLLRSQHYEKGKEFFDRFDEDASKAKVMMEWLSKFMVEKYPESQGWLGKCKKTRKRFWDGPDKEIEWANVYSLIEEGKKDKKEGKKIKGKVKVREDEKAKE